MALPLLPLGIEWAAEAMGWRFGVPIDLIFSVLGCAVVVCLYGLLLRWQGEWLQAHEQGDPLHFLEGLLASKSSQKPKA